MAGTHAVMENKYNHVTPGKVVRIIVLIALLLFLAAPLLWQISLAFKGPKDDMYAAPYLIPVDPTIQNFVDVFNRLPLLFYVCNTLIVAALNIGGNIISGCFAGYSIALLKFKGKGLVVGLLFLSMLVPGETILISQFLIYPQPSAAEQPDRRCLAWIGQLHEHSSVHECVQGHTSRDDRSRRGRWSQCLATVLARMRTSGQGNHGVGRHLLLHGIVERLPVAVNRAD